MMIYGPPIWLTATWQIPCAAGCSHQIVTHGSWKERRKYHKDVSRLVSSIGSQEPVTGCGGGRLDEELGVVVGPVPGHADGVAGAGVTRG